MSLGIRLKGARGRFILGIASLLCVAVSVWGQTPSQPTATPAPVARRATERPFPPARYIPPHNYDQRNIKLNLRFDWEQEQAIGSATITLAPTVKDLRRVDFDAALMTISTATLVNGSPLKFEYDETKEKLWILLDRAYQPNEELTVVISYRTNKPTPARSLALGGGGLNFIKPRPDDPTRPRQIWTQGETETNHFWFPSFDHPNDFVTTEIVATVEKPLIVISNGALLSTKENSDGTRTFDWKIDQPHATYLTSIIVGEFAPVTGEYAGIPITTYVYPKEIEEGKVTAARLPEMVKFFSEKTGIKYPYAKYAQTTVRDFGGGMENISATTQTDNMIHDARTELDANSDPLQAHELAHQWFGDYLTCRTWSDLWLNEGFATYFQAMWDEHKFGHDEFLYSDVKGNQENYYAAWARGQRRPIVTKNYANPDAVFDTYSYQRAGAVLHMLRTFLGEDNWWRSINHYLIKHANQPVETAQFRIAIEETTGQPMDWFFDQWVYKMGHPVFRVTQDYDATNKVLTLKVRQEQRPDPESQYPQVTFFQTPIDVEIMTAGNRRVDRLQIEAKEEQLLKFVVDSEPLLVNFDNEGTLIKELMFVKTTGQLIYQLQNDRDPLGRIWASSQLSVRMREEKTSPADREAILKALSQAVTKEQFWGTKVEILVALNGVKEAREALIAGTKDTDARVRARAVGALAATKDPTLADTYRQLLNDRSYAVIRASASALGQTRSAAAYDALVKLIDQPSWRDTIRASSLSGLAALGDKRALELGIKYYAAGNTGGVRAAALSLLGSTGKDDPRVLPILTGVLNEGLERHSFQLISAAGEAMIALGDERAISTLEELAKKAGDSPQLAMVISSYQSRLKARLSSTKVGS
jgi:aminopeptidase N